MSRPDGNDEDGGGLPVGASDAKRPALRRGLLGYRREDVRLALDARDAEVAELRQDIAALWLAFGQHDRMIRAALEQDAAARPMERPRRPEAPAPVPAPPAQSAPGGPETPPDVPAESITRQLSELDDVLAAIETATQSLERSYAEEIAPQAPGEPTSTDDLPAADSPHQRADG